MRTARHTTNTSAAVVAGNTKQEAEIMAPTDQDRPESPSHDVPGDEVPSDQGLDSGKFSQLLAGLEENAITDEEMDALKEEAQLVSMDVVEGRIVGFWQTQNGELLVDFINVTAPEVVEALVTHNRSLRVLYGLFIVLGLSFAVVAWLL